MPDDQTLLENVTSDSRECLVGNVVVIAELGDF